MKALLKNAFKGLPLLRDVFEERDRLRREFAIAVERCDEVEAERDRLGVHLTQLQKQIEEAAAASAHLKTWVPPGHFYSPIPSPEEIAEREDELWPRPMPPRTLAGIDLREEEQMSLFQEFIPFYREMPFRPQRQPHLRYFFENTNFSYSDAIFLHCMIRSLSPRRIVEVGSGYSSCVMLDTNEIFFGGSIRCTFVEPYPDLLLTLIREDDKERINILAQKVQDVPDALFEELEAGDILFIDSSHVSKAGSDVNHILFNVLPKLRSGVYVHFHDIFYPFVYPREWEMEGRAWNEAYVLRAFLQYNNSFEIVLFNTFIEYFHYDEFMRDMPLCMKSPGGSLWLRRL